MNPCAIEGCGKRAEKREWCAMHYRRWRVYGDPNVTKKASPGNGYTQDGYLGHQVRGVRKFDHVSIAEAALGKPLPPGAVVHHWDEDRANNTPSNLLICPDRAYHNLIHARMRAMAASGDPSQRACRHCKQYDALENLRNYETSTGSMAHWHPQCARDDANKRNMEKRK